MSNTHGAGRQANPSTSQKGYTLSPQLNVYWTASFVFASNAVTAGGAGTNKSNTWMRGTCVA